MSAHAPPLGGQQVDLESARGQTFAVPGWARMTHPQRVAYLRRLANEYAADPRMRWFAVDRILRPQGIPTRDEPAMAQALLAWVQENVYYTQEWDEQIQSPWRTLQVRTGDCDDAALLLTSLACAVGLDCRMVLAGRDRQGKMYRWAEGERAPRGVEFFHIYCEFRWPRGGPTHHASAEPTFRGAPLGYDLVYHGITTDSHGRPFLGEAQKDAMRGLRKISPNERAGAGFYGDMDKPALFSRAFMVGTLTDGVSAAIVSIVTFIVMDYVQDWWKSRKKHGGRK